MQSEVISHRLTVDQMLMIVVSETTTAFAVLRTLLLGVTGIDVAAGKVQACNDGGFNDRV